MKRLIALISALTVCLSASAQGSSMPEKPRIDKNIELLSMVFRLAGSQEYNLSEFKLYTDVIDDRFADFKDHEMVGLAVELESKHGIGFNAIPSIALCLDGELNFRKDLADGWPDRFTTLYEAVDSEWFSRFFGVATTDDFRMVIGALNGPCNYASQVNTTDGSREVYAVIGARVTDENGMPVFRV